MLDEGAKSTIVKSEEQLQNIESTIAWLDDSRCTYVKLIKLAINITLLSKRILVIKITHIELHNYTQNPQTTQHKHIVYNTNTTPHQPEPVSQFSSNRYRLIIVIVELKSLKCGNKVGHDMLQLSMLHKYNIVLKTLRSVMYTRIVLWLQYLSSFFP